MVIVEVLNSTCGHLAGDLDGLRYSADRKAGAYRDISARQDRNVGLHKLLKARSLNGDAISTGLNEVKEIVPGRVGLRVSSIPVLTFRRVTEAPATAAWLGSVTIP